ncbi:acyl-CoA N-acyltransferase [Cryphonectria parasitica EP155]|uniref:Acyl-CoA N-acyltransferase n=1 Tax=Cryphonectria parasitica (strain ATCC 38755 / EP155) TaxID=660469 RepID=A0A9P4YB08_CRYP1|nr:acyl-CoA N-acyltransferase [Cryphonectria parasitica EP155]KAF3769709.1 acyl-CoA N-acyltransferase [Cryphonectria parasitica EP155]
MAQSISQTIPSRFQIRPASTADVPAMTDVFFSAFNAPFWQYFMPDTPYMRGWMDRTWAKGLNYPTDRTFVVVDAEAGDRIVAFSRWQVPQEDGNQTHDAYEDVKYDDGVWDKEVADPFFGGMDENREKLMEKRPHWFLDLLGVHGDYQRKGIAGMLISWGTEQADRDGLPTLLHGSENGQPYYIKSHRFEDQADIPIPDRPAYGSYSYRTLVRKPQPSAA